MDAFLPLLTIFMLAVFVGFEIITKIPPTLHTPLMSGSNAISGITLVGAILGVGFARGIAALNLRTIGTIFMSWIITLPAGAGLSIIFFFTFKGIFG